MNRAAFVLMAGLLVASTAIAMVLPVKAQDSDVQATISALQTEVADLQTQVAALSSPTPSQIESESTQSSLLYGDISSLVPAGEPDVVDVVAVGDPVRSSLPIVVRNNTGRDILLDSILVTARDSAGSLVTVSEVSSLAPNYLPAGGIAVGDAYFGTTDIPAGLTFEFEPQTQEVDASFVFRQDVMVQEVTNIGSGLVGIAVNQTDEELTGPFSVVGICLDSSGTVQGYYSTYAAKNALAPGETTPFDATFYGTGPCDVFAIGVTGYKGM